MDLPSPQSAGHPRPLAVFGEFVSATVILGLAAICLALLVAAVPSVSDPGDSTSGANPHARYHRTPPAAAHLYIVVVTETRAAEYRDNLVAEASLRAALGEVSRDAEVISVETEAEARVIAAIIEDQARIPGVAPMTALVAR